MEAILVESSRALGELLERLHIQAAERYFRALDDSEGVSPAFRSEVRAESHSRLLFQATYLSVPPQ